MLTPLLKELSELADMLAHSNKHQTAAHFRQIAQSVIAAAGDVPQLRQVLTELKSSGAMVQYANFTSEEEKKLFFGVFVAADKVIAAHPA